MVDAFAPPGNHKDSVMAVPRNGRLYALTSLQIGDIQSYVSRLFLLVAYEGLKLVFLVDNRPWTVNTRPSRPAELWQLMVTKSRGSPFANRLRPFSKGEHEGHAMNSGQQRLLKREGSHTRLGSEKEKEDGWLSLLVALQQSLKERAQLKKPSHGLYGCVAFEVAWADVRGINYTNELQTDTCVGLEVRVMVKREFDSLEQAQACYATILSGSADLGPNLSVAKIPSGRTGSTFVRYTAQDQNLRGLVLDGARGANRERSLHASNIHLGATKMEDSAVGAIRSSGAVDKQVKKRQLDETIWPCESRPSNHTGGECGRAYYNSLNPRFGSGLDPDNAGGGLHSDYFTPPSSPYSGQAFQNHFKSFSSHQYKDPKKSRVWPIDHCEGNDRNSQETSESISHKMAQAGGRVSIASVGNLGGENSKAFYDKSKSSGLSHGSLDRGRPLGYCARCRVSGVGTQVHETQECLKCSGSAEVRQERVYVDPDRLIAPAETYRDTLIMFRFSEPMLPLELKRIITADQRLLKMLESGLPSWVLFLQSYPIFSHLYRPWMRPLCGTIYYLISIVTVLIGFYDLYKNVPVLKATAAHICGPLFERIEEWGMVSRLKYLGTMLFLQNCEKAFEWTIAVIRACRQISALLMRPVLRPLILFGETFMPVWEGISSGVQALVQVTSAAWSSVFVSVSSMLTIIIWPVVMLFSFIWSFGMAVLFPLFSAIWTVLVLPMQLVKLLTSLVAGLSSEVMDGIRNMWYAFNNGIQLIIATRSPTLQSLKVVKSSTPGPSMWRTLWNDIFSKVFHAVGSIVKGLLAFFTACNRHRLSIYNHLVEFLVRVSHVLKSGQYVASTACRQFFSLPDPSESDAEVSVEEVEPELEMEETLQFPSELPGLRLRLKGENIRGPMLLIQGQPSTAPVLKRNSCHLS